MGYLKYKGYTGSVEYSEEDKCLYGKVQGMMKDGITINAFIRNAVARALDLSL